MYAAFAPRRMISSVSTLLLLASLVAGQSINPTNDSAVPAADSSLNLVFTSGSQSTTTVVVPLTSGAGLSQPQLAFQQIHYTGTLKLADPSTAASVTKEDIPVICCDSNVATSNITPSDVLNQVLSLNGFTNAVLLYSLVAAQCNITGAFPASNSNPSILTMTKASDASILFKALSMATQNATISNPTVNAPSPTPSSGIASNTPTTAVAMSILYSITGIITVLFLVIIATGAYRAHRHPERYGRREGALGRPRQSRAKGLARAMLETLPIVKFGDPEPPKPGSQDIELEDGRAQEHQVAVVEEVRKSTSESSKPETTPEIDVVEEAGGIGPNTVARSINSEDDVKGSELGCSICTEDFTKGEDVRVLPCNHKYHPACIDPWLLNVSGTCPLCRVDLRPTPTHTSETAETSADGVIPPPLEGETDATTRTHRSRAARSVDMSQLHHASVHERIAALRQLRVDQRQEGGIDAEEPGRRARLTGRLRDVFRIRTRTESVPEEAGEAPAESNSTPEATSRT